MNIHTSQWMNKDYASSAQLPANPRNLFSMVNTRLAASVIRMKQSQLKHVDARTSQTDLSTVQATVQDNVDRDIH